MKYGITKTGKMHKFTDRNECLCNLNVRMRKEVLEESALIAIQKKVFCKDCLRILEEIKMPYKSVELLNLDRPDCYGDLNRCIDRMQDKISCAYYSDCFEIWIKTLPSHKEVNNDFPNL